MFTSQNIGFELLAKELKDNELNGVSIVPSLNHWLESKKLYVTKADIRSLRTLLKNTKWKLVKVLDYQVIRREKIKK